MRTLILAMLICAVLCGGCVQGELTVFGSGASEPLAGVPLPEGCSRAMRSFGLGSREGTWSVPLAVKLEETSHVAIGILEQADRFLVHAAVVTHESETSHSYDPIGTFRPLDPENPDKEQPVGVIVLTMSPRPGIRYRLLVGWVRHPEVAEFTLKCSNGASATLGADSHRFFFARLPAAGDTTVERIVARDAAGDVLADYSPGP